MKHIKIFEDFFKYYKFSTDNENKQLWGYTREDIEDLFLEITDEWSLPISIDFITCPIRDGKISGENISTDDSDKSLLKKYTQEKVRPRIQVMVFTNHEFNTSIIGEDIEFKIYSKNGEHHEDLGDKFLKGLEKTTEEIRSKLESIIKTGRLSDYDIKISQNLDIDNTIGVHPESGIEYGRSFLFFTMTRKKFDEVN
jgi:hypothetical protein